MPRILLVDDDDALVDVLKLSFEDAGHEALSAPNGAAALARVRAGGIDAVVSDVNMPILDGFALCRTLRAEGNPIPIVLLTSRDGEIDEALGLELGADDYVSKPFSTRVLLARVASLLRREQRRAAQTPEKAIACGPLELRVERLEALYAGVSFAVTVSEFRLLEGLVRRPGVVLSRERLLELVRGDESVVADRIIDTYVRRLRRKLETIEPSFSSIETVVGAGYRWRDDAR